jgi:hypothetical protein
VKTNLRRSIECLAFFGITSIAVAGSNVGLGPSSGDVGSEIDVPVIFNSTDGVVGVQFDLVYDPSEVSLIEDPFAGTSVANHKVESEEIELGRTRVVVTSNTNDQLANGFLSILPMRLSKAVAAGTDSLSLDNVIFADQGGSSVSINLDAFLGAYFGTISSSSVVGDFALFVRSDQTAVFLAYDTGSDRGILGLNVAIASDGTFSFTTDDGGIEVEGDIDRALVTGSIPSLSLTFNGTQSELLGPNLERAGIYEAAVVNTTSGLAYSIIGSDGRTYLYVSGPAVTDAGSGTVNTFGVGTITGSSGVEFSINTDSATSLFSGNFTIGDQDGRFVGLREGAERDDQLANISTRGKVKTGPRKMIAGFVISGAGTKQVLIRAIGPTLGSFNVPGTIENPILELFKSGAATPDFANDDWGTLDVDLVRGTTTRLGAFPLGDGSADSVLLLSLAPGGYTAQVSGVADGVGVGLVEVYDGDDPLLGESTAEVINISTRGEIGTQSDVLIAGFVINGSVPKRVLIRGIGPTLGDFNVPGTIVDPKLELFAARNGAQAPPFVINNDWQDDDGPAIAAAGAVTGGFPLADGSADAAILIWLEPGTYTAKVSGNDGGTGVGLVEVYEVP